MTGWKWMATKMDRKQGACPQMVALEMMLQNLQHFISVYALLTQRVVRNLMALVTEGHQTEQARSLALQLPWMEMWSGSQTIRIQLSGFQRMQLSSWLDQSG